jgi:hypothetical protein
VCGGVEGRYVLVGVKLRLRVALSGDRRIPYPRLGLLISGKVVGRGMQLSFLVAFVACRRYLSVGRYVS